MSAGFLKYISKEYRQICEFRQICCNVISWGNVDTNYMICKRDTDIIEKIYKNGYKIFGDDMMLNDGSNYVSLLDDISRNHGCNADLNDLNDISIDELKIGRINKGTKLSGLIIQKWITKYLC